MKYCSACNSLLPLEAFGKQTGATDGHRPNCKACVVISNKRSKEKRRRPGVYRITNTRTGEAYIGAATDPASRWSRHKHELAKHAHVNGGLQQAFNKYGASAFEFVVVEQFSCIEAARICEQNLIDRSTNLYNQRGVL